MHEYCHSHQEQRIMNQLRSVLVGLAGASLIVAMGAVPSAAATPLPLACASGNQNATFTPGIVLTPRTVAVGGSGQLSTCITTDGTNIVTGAFDVSGGGTASCLAASLPTTNTVTWTTAGGATYTSVIAFSSGIDLKPLGTSVVVLTGTVTSGLYAGRTVEKTIILVGSSLASVAECLNTTGPGITAGGGPIQLAVL